MDIWMNWLDAFRGLLHFLASDVGLGAGLSIIGLTLILKTAILPISWTSAYRGCIRQKKMALLQPELLRLKDRFANDPQAYAKHMMALYRKHELTLMDGRSMLGGLAQMPILLGMYQVLRDGANGARFLWVQSLSRPDMWLALLAGITTMAMMAANPNLPEQIRIVMILVPSILAVMMALKFCSALALYLTVSNCFSALQTTALHCVVARRIKSGALKI